MGDSQLVASHVFGGLRGHGTRASYLAAQVSEDGRLKPDDVSLGKQRAQQAVDEIAEHGFSCVCRVPK